MTIITREDACDIVDHALGYVARFYEVPASLADALGVARRYASGQAARWELDAARASAYAYLGRKTRLAVRYLAEAVASAADSGSHHDAEWSTRAARVCAEAATWAVGYACVCGPSEWPYGLRAENAHLCGAWSEASWQQRTYGHTCAAEIAAA